MGKAKIQPQTYTAVKYSLGARPLPAHSNSGRQPQTCAKYACGFTHNMALLPSYGKKSPLPNYGKTRLYALKSPAI